MFQTATSENIEGLFSRALGMTPTEPVTAPATTPTEPAPITTPVAPDSAGEPATPGTEGANTDANTKMDPEVALINKKFNKQFKNIEEINESLGRADEFAKLSEWKSSVEPLLPSSSEAKEIVKAMNRGMTLEKYQQFKALNLEKMSVEDKLVQMMVLRDGLTEGEANAIVAAKYGDTSIYEEGSQQLLAISGQQKLDAKDADKFLEEYRESLFEKEVIATPADINAAWGDKIETLMEKEVSKLEFSFDGNNLAYELPAQERKAIIEKTVGMITQLSNSGVDFGPTNKDANNLVKQIMKDNVTLGHHKDILNSVLNQYKTNTLRSKANPVDLSRQKAPDVHNGIATADQMAQAILNLANKQRP